MLTFISRLFVLGFFICFFYTHNNNVFAQEDISIIHSQQEGGSWSNTSTWIEERIPGENDIVIINGEVLLDIDTTIMGLQLSQTALLRSSSNIYRNILSLGDIYNQGSIQKIILRAGSNVIHTGEHIGTIHLLGGEQNMIGDFSFIVLEADVSSDISLLSSKIRTNGYRFLFNKDNKFVNTQTILGSFETNGTIRMVGEIEDDINNISDTIHAPKIIFTGSHRLKTNTHYYVNEFIINTGAEIKAFSSRQGSLLTELIVHGNVINKGIILPYVSFKVNNGFSNYGIFSGSITAFGDSNIQSFSGISSSLFRLEDNIVLANDIEVKDFKPQNKSVIAINQNTKIEFNSMSGGVHAPDIHLVARGIGSLRKRSDDGNIVAKSLIIYGDFETYIQHFYVDDFIIKYGAKLSNPLTQYRELHIHGNFKNDGQISGPYYLRLYRNIYQSSGVFDSLSIHLQWMEQASSEYYLSLSESTSFQGEAIYLDIPRYRNYPTAGSIYEKTIREIINNGDIVYWRYQIENNQWSNTYHINLDSYQDPFSRDHFFTISPIAHETHSSFDIHISARDALFEGELHLYLKQGSISPKKVIMSKGEASVSLDLGNNKGSHNQLIVNTGPYYGYSNFFNNQDSFYGNLLGQIEGNYPQVNVILFQDDVNYQVLSDNSGAFYFQDVLCGNYTISLVGEYNGHQLSSLGDNIIIPCGGNVSHLVTNINLENCNDSDKIPVLLVPGILGSSKKGTIGVYPDLPVIPPQWSDGSLQLHNVSLALGPLTLYDAVGWKKISNSLLQNNYQKNCTLFEVPYYWAHDTQVNARDYLKHMINYAKRVSGKEQIDIIAHSMGGIVARAYIQSDYFENDVRRFAMVGTPNQGAALPYYIWEGGDVISADRVSDNTGIFSPSRYLYTHSLAKFYENKTGKKVCKDIPVVGQEIINIFITGDMLEPECERHLIYDFVRNHVPALKQLLASYPHFIVSHESDESIEYPVNSFLFNLNEDYGVLNTIETRLFVGIESEDRTLETIRVLSHHEEEFYQEYGYPQYEELLRSAGDGTVSEYSIVLDGITVYGNYNSSHAGLPKKAYRDLIDFVSIDI